MFLCPMQRNLATKTGIKPNPTMLMALSTVLLFMSNTLAGLMFIVQQNLISYARNKFNILTDFFQLLYFLCYFDMSSINPTVIFLLIEQAIKSLQSLFFRLLFIWTQSASFSQNFVFFEAAAAGSPSSLLTWKLSVQGFSQQWPKMINKK